MAGSAPPVIFIAGPTASGKSALAMELASVLPAEIVNVDAAQVYRGLDIGTAKPSPAERAQVPHHLIDIRDPSEIYTAADFRADALRAIRSITDAGHIPMLVGGTMFYFRALEYGLPDLPSADPQLRRRLTADAERVGWDVMHGRLAEQDPDRAARIHPNDPQRILRALEIIALTGRAASDHRLPVKPGLPYRVIKVFLYPDARSWLHARIAARFDAMLEQGFLEEARELFARPELDPALPALRAVGYRQVGLYLTGKINYKTMIEQAITATRQLAKRQMTWMRGETPDLRLDCSAGDPRETARNRLIAMLS